jgi:hypothetical protein
MVYLKLFFPIKPVAKTGRTLFGAILTHLHRPPMRHRTRMERKGALSPANELKLFVPGIRGQR